MSFISGSISSILNFVPVSDTLADEPNIREVVAFPMNQQAEDLLMGAPAAADVLHLKELHIRVNLPPEK